MSSRIYLEWVCDVCGERTTTGRSNWPVGWWRHESTPLAVCGTCRNHDCGRGVKLGALLDLARPPRTP